MRGLGPSISFGAHAVVLFWGLVSVAPEPFDSEVVEALPVEFVTLAEVTDLTKGVREAPEFIESEEVTETPEVASEAVSEAPGPADVPPPEPQPDPTPAPEVAEKPVEATPPEPEPVPEPVPPTPEPPQEAEAPKVPEAPQPKPEPVKVAKADPTPDPLADLIEEAPETPEVPEEEVKAEAVTAPSAPAPRLNPIPRQQRLASARPDLLDKKKPATTAGGKPKKAASKGTATGRKNAKLTQTELDGLRDAIQRCWALPPGYSAGRDFSAKVRTQLSRDGRVNGRVNVVSVTGFDGGPSILIKNAVKVAIEKCQPYQLPSNKYAEWKNLEVTFFP